VNSTLYPECRSRRVHPVYPQRFARRALQLAPVGACACARRHLSPTSTFPHRQLFLSIFNLLIFSNLQIPFSANPLFSHRYKSPGYGVSPSFWWTPGVAWRSASHSHSPLVYPERTRGSLVYPEPNRWATRHSWLSPFASVRCPFNFQLSTVNSPASPFLSVLPYVFVLSALSTAFTHFDRGCGVSGKKSSARASRVPSLPAAVLARHQPQVTSVQWRTKAVTVSAMRMS